MDFGATTSDEHSSRVRSFRRGWERQFHMPDGELECMLSGYATYAEFVFVCETARRICEIVPYDEKARFEMERHDGPFVRCTQPRREMMQPFFDVVVRYVPFVASMQRDAPLSMVVERVMCSVAGETCDVLGACTSFETLEKMSAELDSAFQDILKDTLPQIRSCVRALSPDIITMKNNYFASSEPILAPYISYPIGKGCRDEFFVSLEKRAKMLRLDCDANMTGNFLGMMASISRLVSEILFAFLLRSLFHMARFIHGERKEKEWENQRENGDNMSTLEAKEDDLRREEEKFEAYTSKICGEFELLAKEELVKCRRYYPHVFVLGGFLVPWEENEERPPTATVLASLLLKIMHLFAGGLKSIAADDMQYNTHDEDVATRFRTKPSQSISCELQSTKNNFSLKEQCVTDDVALASCMSVTVCGWVTMIVKLFGVSPLKQGDHVTAVSCAAVLRVLYQYMGVLPFGSFCPKSILQWIDIFPLYTLEEHEMRTMLQLYARVAERETCVLRPIDGKDFFRSLSRIMRNVEGTVAKRAKSKLVADVIVPLFQDEPQGSFDVGSLRRRRGRLYDLFATSCLSVTQPTIDITKTVQLQVRNKLLTTLSPSLFQRMSDEFSGLRMETYGVKTGALLRWSSAEDLRELRRGDILCVEAKVSLDSLLDMRESAACSAASNSVGTLCLQSLSGPVMMSRSSMLVHLLQETNVVVESSDEDNCAIIEFRWVVSWVYQSGQDEHIVLFEGNMEVPPELELQSVKLVVHFVPPFEAHGSGHVWTNPHFPYEPKNSRWGSFPFALGWLLGNSIGNDMLLRLPIAPLAFRLLRRLVKYNVSLQEAGQLHPCVLNLLDHKFRRQVEDIQDDKLEVLVQHILSTSRGKAAKDVQTLAATHATRALLMNIDNNVEKSLAFWGEVAEGLRLTPLGHSPLLNNCCARVVRNVLCGTTRGDEFDEAGFYWERHFVFLCAPELDKLPYGRSVLHAMVNCLNANFTGGKARDLLMFFTGRSYLPPTPLTECIFLTFVPAQNTCDESGASNFFHDASLRMLPPLWPGHYALEISAPIESLLSPVKRPSQTDTINLNDWKRLLLDERCRLLTTFQEAVKDLLERALGPIDAKSRSDERGVGEEDVVVDLVDFSSALRPVIGPGGETCGAEAFFRPPPADSEHMYDLPTPVKTKREAADGAHTNGVARRLHQNGGAHHRPDSGMRISTASAANDENSVGGDKRSPSVEICARAPNGTSFTF